MDSSVAFTTNFYYRNLEELDKGKIIDYNHESGEIAPKPEAHIMTKNLTKFNSMMRLLEIPTNYGLQQVRLYSYEKILSKFHAAVVQFASL